MRDKSVCEYCGEPLPAPPYTRWDRQKRGEHFQNCPVRLEQVRKREEREAQDAHFNAFSRLVLSGFTEDQATALIDVYGTGRY